jgi:hypothetical protein
MARGSLQAARGTHLLCSTASSLPGHAAPSPNRGRARVCLLLVVLDPGLWQPRPWSSGMLAVVAPLVRCPCCSVCAHGPLSPARSRFLGSLWSLRARFCPVRVLLGRPRDTSSMAAVRRRVPTCAPAPCVAFHSPKPEFASRPCLSVCCCSSLDLAQVAAMVVRCLARADSRSLISPS